MQPHKLEPGDAVRVIDKLSRYFEQDGVITEVCEYVCYVRLVGAVSDSWFLRSCVEVVGQEPGSDFAASELEPVGQSTDESANRALGLESWERR